MAYTIKFAKLRDGAIIPKYGRKGDSCLDIYACFDENEMYIQPHEIALIPTGVCSTFNENYMISVRERGSNTKSGLMVMAGQIDSNYTGEYFVALYNANDLPVELSKTVDKVVKTEDFISVPYNKAIAQLKVEYCPEIKILEVEKEDIITLKTERGDGKLGSSGN